MTNDTMHTDNHRPLSRMPIFVTPLEADILTWFELVSKRDDENRLRIGCPDNPETLYSRWASEKLACTPEEYAEAFERFANAGIIREIAHSDVTGNTTYVFNVEPDQLLTMPIRRRYTTWLDPTAYDAIEAAQQRFRARFAGSAPSRAAVTEFLSCLPIDESPGYTEALFGCIKSQDPPPNGMATMWGICLQEDGEDLYLLCHPDFTAYNFARGRQDGLEADNRKVPTPETVDRATVPCFDGMETGDDTFITVVTSDRYSVLVVRRPVTATALFETCEAGAVIKTCSDDELSAIRASLVMMTTAVASEETRRRRVADLRAQIDAAAEEERLAAERRIGLERELAELEA